MTKILIAVLTALALGGCITTGATKVATDVQVIEKPVPVPCDVTWPEAPKAYVMQVQLTGNRAVDALNISRAKEAELEERMAYELKLEAALRGCTNKPPG